VFVYTPRKGPSTSKIWQHGGATISYILAIDGGAGYERSGTWFQSGYGQTWGRDPMSYYNLAIRIILAIIGIHLLETRTILKNDRNPIWSRVELVALVILLVFAAAYWIR
jgi:hypothetical protein